MYDEDYDEDYDYEAPPTKKQIVKQRVRRALPYVPYAPLAVGLATGSTNWLLASVFTLLAVKPSQKYVTISNGYFTTNTKAPALVIK